MNAAQRRPLFQMHLSTALVLMLAASGLLGINICLPPGQEHACGPRYSLVTVCYGLPCPFWTRGAEYRYASGPAGLEIVSATPVSSINGWLLLANLAAWGLILIAVAIVCEHRLRKKREAARLPH